MIYIYLYRILRIESFVKRLMMAWLKVEFCVRFIRNHFAYSRARPIIACVDFKFLSLIFYRYRKQNYTLSILYIISELKWLCVLSNFTFLVAA